MKTVRMRVLPNSYLYRALKHKHVAEILVEGLEQYWEYRDKLHKKGLMVGGAPRPNYGPNVMVIWGWKSYDPSTQPDLFIDVEDLTG